MISYKARIRWYHIAICDAKLLVCDANLISCGNFCNAIFLVINIIWRPGNSESNLEDVGHALAGMWGGALIGWRHVGHALAGMWGTHWLASVHLDYCLNKEEDKEMLALVADTSMFCLVTVSPS